MTQAIDGIAADNRASAVRTAAQGRSENRGRPHATGAPTAQTIALPELHDGAAASDGSDGPILRDWHPLHQIKARLQACVGEASISVGELLAAKEQQVLRLDRTIDRPIDLTIEGRVVARGHLVAVDGHFAVRITELPIALSLTQGS